MFVHLKIESKVFLNLTKMNKKKQNNFLDYSKSIKTSNGELNHSVFDIENDFYKNKSLDIEISDLYQRHCGNIDNFKRYKSLYKKTKKDFTIVSYGLSRKIIYGGRSLLFNGIKGQEKPMGIHLISLVKKEIDALIRGVYNEEKDIYENKFQIPKIPKYKPILTFVHHKNLEFYGCGVEALAIDINHCYWRTAYLLKYISEELYLKGLEKTEYKDGRLIAIGTLGKVLTIKKYVNGEKVNESVNDEEYKKYGGFYWAVICKVYSCMVELSTKLGIDYLMFLTDCVFIDPSRRDEAISIIESHGYSWKEYKVWFTNIDRDSVSWLTDDGKKKKINHFRRLDRIKRQNYPNE